MSQNTPRSSNESIRELLESLSRETLIDVLVDLADSDYETANYLEVRFGTPRGEDEDIAVLAARIKRELDGASSRRGRDDWGHMQIDVDDIMREIDERKKQGRFRLAFSALEILFLKLQDYYEYQQECEIDDECDYCISRMAEIAKSLTDPSDKEFVFERCIGMCGSDAAKNYGADFDVKLLEIAMDLINRSNRHKFENALAGHEKGWLSDKCKMLNHEAIRRLDGEEAANAYIYDNLDCAPLREIAYGDAIDRHDYVEAERLCLTELESDGSPFRRLSPWLHKLYEVYELSRDIGKQTDTARSILLKGDFNYYAKLKELLIGQNRWDSEYSALRDECADTLPYETYMQVLDAEGEHALLLEQLQKHPEHVFTYGKATSADYPDETSAIFKRCIDKDAKSATNRKDYEAVCSRLERYAGSGYADAAKELIAEYKASFKHRRAFVDELSKAGRRLD